VSRYSQYPPEWDDEPDFPEEGDPMDRLTDATIAAGLDPLTDYYGESAGSGPPDPRDDPWYSGKDPDPAF
jgi:hypothetical protein